MRPPEQAALRAAVAFGHALRDAGLPVCVEDELVFLRALAEVDPAQRPRVYWAARASFMTAPDHLPVFEALFARFWAGDALGLGSGLAEHGESDPRMPGPQHGGESMPQYRGEHRSGQLLGGHPTRAAREVPVGAGEQEGVGERRGALAAYSPAETLTDPEPLRYGRDEVAAVRGLAEELRAVAPERRSRRLRPAARRGRLDVRRTLRDALRTDGEALRPRYEASSLRPRRILLLCDVSGSMERYSRILLASLHAAVAAGIRAEAFVFATRLTRLTGPLGARDVAAALEEARAAVDDWSGGTRIGRAVAELNRTHARRGLVRGALVIVVSDGWDRGDPEVLARELGRLRLQCRRLAWVNPRPASIDGQPLAMGMRAALPHVDDFIPGHDPRALAGLARLIRGLDSGRPARAHRTVGLAAR